MSGETLWNWCERGQWGWMILRSSSSLLSKTQLRPVERIKSHKISSVFAQYHLYYVLRCLIALTYISIFVKPCDGWRQKWGGPIKNQDLDWYSQEIFWTYGGAIYGLDDVKRNNCLDGIRGLEKPYPFIASGIS